MLILYLGKKSGIKRKNIITTRSLVSAAYRCGHKRTGGKKSL